MPGYISAAPQISEEGLPAVRSLDPQPEQDFKNMRNRWLNVLDGHYQASVNFPLKASSTNLSSNKINFW